jgi:uncharacterized protein
MIKSTTKSFAIVLAGSALLWNPSSALADEASKAAKIEEMMQLTHVERMTSQMLDQMKTMITAQIPTTGMSAEARQASDEMKEKMMALIAERISWARAKPEYMRIYSETFTEEEIDGILTFYKSPAGQAMLEKMPQLMQKSMAVGQKLMGDIGPDMERMMKEMKYKHPPQ